MHSPGMVRVARPVESKLDRKDCHVEARRSRSLSVSAEALLHEEMEALKRRRGELKRQCRQAARDSKVLKRQRLLQAGCGQVDSAAALCLCPC